MWLGSTGQTNRPLNTFFYFWWWLITGKNYWLQLRKRRPFIQGRENCYTTDLNRTKKSVNLPKFMLGAQQRMVSCLQCAGRQQNSRPFSLLLWRTVQKGPSRHTKKIIWRPMKIGSTIHEGLSNKLWKRYYHIKPNIFAPFDCMVSIKLYKVMPAYPRQLISKLICLDRTQSSEKNWW